MRPVVYTLLISIVFASCSSSKDYLSRIDEDKTVFDAVKAMNKNGTDSNAIKALQLAYTNAKERHLRKINSLDNSTELARWDKIIDEYGILQKMYDAISLSDAASRIVSPANYQSTVYDLKQRAAEEYYQHGDALLTRGGRAEAKQAYGYFKHSDKLVPGFRDTKARMNEAYQAAIVNVVINPVVDNSFFFNSSWGNYGYNYSNEYFQQTLVRELGGQNSSRYPARFYTDWEARRDNIQADIQVNLTLRNMDIPRPSTNNYSRRNSAQVIVGRDSSGNNVYGTVYAIINIARQSFTARIEMQVEITDVSTHRTLVNNTYREDYSWQEEHASYTGDERAVDKNDWNMINNNHYYEPRKEEVLNELYRRVYPQVKNRISYAVDW
jgi:hypothetical protein